jgi:myo-inositol-1-phosphate synthase
MSKIRIAVVGVGNCASSLIQGIHYYKSKRAEDAIGLMHWDLGGYKPFDIEVVAAFDIDKRKVGKDVSEAIFASPNCTTVFCESVPKTGVTVRMGRILDGWHDHMANYKESQTFVVSDEPEASKEEIVQALKESQASILLNYLPVGSEQAVRFYAECVLEAGLSFINCMPVFIASDPEWADRFKAKGLPIIGDDIKAQLGATITHRTLTDLFRKRGVRLERTYQLNTGGNTDFLNMLDRSRLASKKKSKTEAVQSVLDVELDEDDIHIGPSDYVPWQKDNKVCFLRMEGKLFGDVPMNLELRLSVEDSPNSAGVAIDAVRCCRLALDRGIGGILYAPSAYFMKRPPTQYTDDQAYLMTEAFIREPEAMRKIKCLIIAAGKGSRLWRRGETKPLVPVLGVPLIERVIRTVMKTGVDDFLVVTGYNGDQVRPFLDKLARDCHIKVTHFVNDAWEEGNGLSVLRAKGFLDGPFALLMTDHLFDHKILDRLMRQTPQDGEITLVVDPDIKSPLIDLDDVTRVQCQDSKIEGIGKGLESFNRIDTGIFLCTPAIFDAIEESASEYGDTSLSGGVRRLAAKGKANTMDCDGGFWIDVDDPDSMDRAEQALMEQLRDKLKDGALPPYI